MMKLRSILYRLALSLSMNAVAADFSATRTPDVSLSAPARQADGSMKMTLSGQAAAPVLLQSSADLKAWTDLKSFDLKGEPIQFVDDQAPAATIRYYRLKGVEAAPVNLPDLGGLANQVFVPGEGFDTVQYAPDGRLGFIFWRNRDLVLRERTVQGAWSEQVIESSGNLFQVNSSRQDFLFQPAAILLYDSNSNPHVFKLDGGTGIAHFARNGGSWTKQETIQNNQANTSLAQLIGAVGPNNVFHLGTITAGSSPRISYGSTRNGSWSWNHVTDIGAYPSTWLPWTYAARWFSLAVDSRNNAHFAFRPAFSISYHPQGYPRAYSELAYASNASGSWSVRTVHKPADISGEAGIGASIAIGPDDKPRLVSWYNERADTGSAQWSRLYYHEQDGSGNWVANTVTSRPDGYVAGDGEKGTGFAPYLRFDGKGRPHIVFSDHAGEHSWSSGQTEFTGQIRHAWWNGSQWVTQRVFEQSNPLTQQLVYPAFAISGSEIAFTGLQRLTDWNWGVYPPSVTSTYKHVFVTKPLP